MAEEGGGAERLGELEERLSSLERRVRDLTGFCLRLERDLPWVMRAIDEIAEFLVEYGFLPVGLVGEPFNYMRGFRRYLEDRWRRHEEAARRRAEKLRRLMKTRYD